MTEASEELRELRHELETLKHSLDLAGIDLSTPEKRERHREILRFGENQYVRCNKFWVNIIWISTSGIVLFLGTHLWDLVSAGIMAKIGK